MILKLYNGTTTPVYTPTNLVLSAYSGYADDRKTYSGKFKIEQLVGDTWSVAQDITTTASTTLSVKLSDILDSSATKVRCYLYSNDETPMLIDFVTLDIVDDFSSMLSVQNNKTYVDGGNVYCATLDADAIFSNDINFTGTITGGDVNGGGIIKSYNYVVNTSGTKINLYDGTIDSKNFKVSSTGVIEARDANLTGVINANSGKIGSTLNGLYFNISEDGELYTGSKSSLNSNLNGVYVGHNGICCGGGGYNSTYYQFRVDKYGQMTCSYAGISDANISSGTISSATVNNATINNATINTATISEADIESGEIGGFYVNGTRLSSPSNKTFQDNIQGCYISPDGIEYKGSQYTFRINRNGECYSDRLMSNQGLQMIAHNTIDSDNTNGNLVIGYNNRNNTNIYGNMINLSCDPSYLTSESPYAIEFYQDSSNHVVFRPKSTDCMFLGTGSKRWFNIYGAYGYFDMVYENGTALSSKYASKNYISTASASSYISCGANTTGDVTVMVGKDGYTLIGCIGVNVAGTASTFCNIVGFILNGNSGITVRYKNNYTKSVSWTVKVTGLFIKD